MNLEVLKKVHQKVLAVAGWVVPAVIAVSLVKKRKNAGAKIKRFAEIL